MNRCFCSRLCFCAVILFCLGLINIFSAEASVQEAGDKSLSKPTIQMLRIAKVDFEIILQTISDQSGYTFLVEGAPVNVVLPDDRSALWSGRTAGLDEMVDSAANDFDYSVNYVRGSKIVLLKKRYSDAADMPCVTSREMADSLADIERIFRPFNPKYLYPGVTNPDGSTLALIDSLNAEQKEAWLKGTLNTKNLRVEQKKLLQHLVLTFGVENPATSIPGSKRHLKEMKTILVGIGERVGRSFWGFQDTDTLGRVGHHPFLEHALDTVDGKPYYGSDDSLKKIMDPSSDEKTPEEKRAVSKMTDIKRLVESLPPPQTGSFQVDPALEEKPVTAFFPSDAKRLHRPTPEVLFQAITDLYGLRARKEPAGGGWTLVRRTVQIPASVEGVPDAVHNALPEPILRTMVAPVREEPLWTPEEDKKLTPLEKQKRQMQREMTRQPTRIEALQSAALSQVQVAVTQVLAQKRKAGKASESDRLVPVGELDLKAQRSLTFLLSYLFLRDLRGSWGKDLTSPFYLARFNDMILCGSVYKSKETGKLRANFLLKDPGQQFPCPGLAGLDLE